MLLTPDRAHQSQMPYWRRQRIAPHVARANGLVSVLGADRQIGSIRNANANIAAG